MTAVTIYFADGTTERSVIPDEQVRYYEDLPFTDPAVVRVDVKY